MYASARISYDELLDALDEIHRSNALNRQGSNLGVQHRFPIFYYNPNRSAVSVIWKNAFWRMVPGAHWVR